LVASDPSLQNSCGKYWSDCEITKESNVAQNPLYAKRLWEMTEKAIQQKIKI
jgi:hypothetical protein